MTQAKVLSGSDSVPAPEVKEVITVTGASATIAVLEKEHQPLPVELH